LLYSDLQQKVALLQAEKDSLAKQLEQFNQKVKETLGPRADAPIPGAPPAPAPAAPKAPAPPPAAPKAPATGGSATPAPQAETTSLEEQILSMKEFVLATRKLRGSFY